jgi:cleavage and polyadenylation specificity factor subunit 5
VKLYAMQLPDKFVFHAPEKSSLMAVPLFAIIDDAAKYGPVLSSLPYLVSRLATANVHLEPA